MALKFIHAVNEIPTLRGATQSDLTRVQRGDGSAQVHAVTAHDRRGHASAIGRKNARIPMLIRFELGQKMFEAMAVF